MPDRDKLPLPKLATRLRPADGLILLACGALLAAFIVTADDAGYRRPPDFGSLPVDEKKEEFFAYLSPIVEDVNAQLASDRDRLGELLERHRAGDGIGWLERRWVRRQARRLEVEYDADALGETLEVLYRRAGIVPESLVLAQAAIESGWGTSRFAVEGNNFFGQRCYREDCGIAPRGRPNARFGLAAFDSIWASVESYMLNLNTHPEYRPFRDLRLQRRTRGEPITGLALLSGLHGYSERGAEYVDQVAAMIRSNGLE